ncbi:tRNA pseudouridine(38-40) synthase TruA [Geoalkalibacter halelectricus]|uniref:tRNA pseudouridine synthase A n=1 Tax=Geoalkalibacter halelectricus TaxID=2847045 RepID=A0ABY5ZJR2_9BACT|nr:tRNA pseudouridine(38-40) synthase TruA [Geoalkalibacter halelectricus]MDO3379419.1 tRNA pseudouridine(38-40) synthase TruA [Geoalkalibacter halelectricus]UWZ78704.1 tRNA pseudouridine(38-40) synthase TruA [Geoalkalibacter halelectricus]
MANIRLILEYDGTAYAGWQRQPNGLGIQQVVEESLHQLLGTPVTLISSGRTDAGVHARGMVANFHTERDLPPAAYREGLNGLLPKDIAVQDAMQVRDAFHARYDARGKWYRYCLCRNPVRSPLYARYSWQLRADLDLAAMRQAASALVGRHDFQAFRTAGCAARTTTREIFSVDFAAEGKLLFIDVRGSGFLRNMVRVMVGTLVEIGLGKRPPEDMARLVGDGRGRAGPTAPPQGLCLMEVWY